MVAIKAILFHCFFFAIVIGIIKTSGGIGKTKLSINETKPKNVLEFLCPAKSIDLRYKFLNIFTFTNFNLFILLNKLYKFKNWANGGTGRRVGLKIQ